MSGTSTTVAETVKSQSLDPEISEGCCSKTLMQIILNELKLQMRIGLPLVVMNLLWFGKITTTSVFLGRQGELNLAGGSLGFSFANVTGFAVLYGTSAAMKPICGQAFGAKNFKLLHKTLLMGVILLLLMSIPISILWLNVHKILIAFGQREDISFIAKRYLLFFLPDLPVLSLLFPLKAYLIMYATAAATSLHIPINIFLSRAKGIQGVAMAVWITDFVVTILRTGYVILAERSKREQMERRWVVGPMCSRLAIQIPNPVQSVSILVIVLNFDFLLYGLMLSLGICVATRVSNELGANNRKGAYRAAYTTLAVGVVSGCIGALVMIGCRGFWGSLYTHHDQVILNGVKKMMLIMAVIEVINFPLMVCGEIVRGTAKPSLGMYANLGGFLSISFTVGGEFSVQG